MKRSKSTSKRRTTVPRTNASPAAALFRFLKAEGWKTAKGKGPYRRFTRNGEELVVGVTPSIGEKARPMTKRPRLSLLARLEKKGLVGSVHEAPLDLSTNHAYLEDLGA